MRLYSRNAYDWTTRLSAIAAAAERISAKSFTIDGEAVVFGPDALSQFEELRRRKAADTAILYAFDLIEHDGEDMRNSPLLDRKAALARLPRDTIAANKPMRCLRILTSSRCDVGIREKVEKLRDTARCPLPTDLMAICSTAYFQRSDGGQASER